MKDFLTLYLFALCAAGILCVVLTPAVSALRRVRARRRARSYRSRPAPEPTRFPARPTPPRLTREFRQRHGIR